MMVRVTLEGLKETGEKTFETLAQGMGGNIAHAAIYSKSIKEAMKAELESTLESLSAQAITYAIFSTALGFTDLAEGNEAGATAVFTAAAGGGASKGSSGSGSADTRGADTGAIWPEQRASGRNVTVNVWGHVVGTSGVSEFANMLNDAVLNSDVQLTATNTKTGVQLQR